MMWHVCDVIWCEVAWHEFVCDVTCPVSHNKTFINHWSSIINERSSIINHQASIFNYRSSITHHQSSIFQLSITYHPPLISDHQPSITHHKSIAGTDGRPEVGRPRATAILPIHPVCREKFPNQREDRGTGHGGRWVVVKSFIYL